MIKELSDAEIWEVIDTAQYAHLGCHSEGKTYVVPVSYARDGGRFVGATTFGQKVEMMRQNPEVCLQIERIESLTRWKSVVVSGVYEELSAAERAQAFGLLIDRYGPTFAEEAAGERRGRDVTPPRLDGSPEPMIVYAISIRQVSGRSEGF